MLSHLEPKQVFSYFEQICRIPHGSGNTRQISDFVVDFAKSHGLSYIQDQWNNVILFQPGTKGYEQSPPVILQGHLDMVCEKEPGSAADLQTKGPDPVQEGDWIRAKETTLGGDDGIAIAYCLALLDSEEIPHPPLEVVFTTDEETGMDGAVNIDLSMLKGKRLINLDSEEEGHILCGCAGGLCCDCRFPAKRTEKKGILLTLRIEGLLGGHSGTEIHKHRANANVLMGRLLWGLSRKFPLGLYRLEGGSKDNVIPAASEAVLLVRKEDQQQIDGFCRETEETFSGEYGAVESQIHVFRSFGEPAALDVVWGDDAAGILDFLFCAPNGVQEMSGDIEGLVETSCNLGVTFLEQDAFLARISLRSSVHSRKQWLADRIRALTEKCGGSFLTCGDYPGWEYNRDSSLRKLLQDIFVKRYQREPKLEVIHAGLECGIFCQKIPGLDCVSIGPDILDIHTPKERLSVSSTVRVWDYLLEILKNSRE